VTYEAVIFDLGGTLTYPFYWTEYTEVRKKVAGIIAAPEEDVHRIWGEDGHLIGAGVYPTYQSFVREICGRIGIAPEDTLIDASVEPVYEMTRRLMAEPRDGALELLAHLRDRGYRTGLVSDCGPDVPELWDASPFAPWFDMTVFSCRVGLVKTDARIFRLALDRLGVAPGKCIYVADGMRRELASAAELGMRSLRLKVPGEENDSPMSEQWDGESIASLAEIIPLLGGLPGINPPSVISVPPCHPRFSLCHSRTGGNPDNPPART
jgi:putative hydrolase of the HAD superfamily